MAQTSCKIWSWMGVCGTTKWGSVISESEVFVTLDSEVPTWNI
jgi:hypothetical protein